MQTNDIRFWLNYFHYRKNINTQQKKSMVKKRVF